MDTWESERRDSQLNFILCGNGTDISVSCTRFLSSGRVQLNANCFGTCEKVFESDVLIELTDPETREEFAGNGCITKEYATCSQRQSMDLVWTGLMWRSNQICDHQLPTST